MTHPDAQRAFEEMMPEPAAHRYMSHGHSSRWQLAGRAVPPDAEPLYTADQMRQMFDAATERAAKVWLPIESAPKDGTRVILDWGGKSITGFYLDNSATPSPWQGWRVESMVPRPGGNPTRWMPFPSVLPTASDGSILTPEGYRVYPPSVAAVPHGIIIKALAGLVTAHRTDEQFDADVQPSDPVRAAVSTIKEALEDIMTHVPKVDLGAAAIRSSGRGEG